jgi:plastocyanin
MSVVQTRRHARAAGGVVLLTLLSACGSPAAHGGGASTSIPPAPSAAAASGMPSDMPMPSQDGGVSAATAPTATNSVAIANFGFGPQAVVVKAGATVTWTQQDEDAHTVTADDGSFSSQPLDHGQIYSHTFTTPGTYSYHCSIHPFMHGTVVVSNG